MADGPKGPHGFGHGHAAAITSDLLAEGTPGLTADEQVDRLFPDKKALWRPVYESLAREISGFGDVKILPKNTLVGFGTRSQFAMLQPSTPDRLDVASSCRASIRPSGSNPLEAGAR